MARKWTNLNLPGALHFVTGNFLERTPIFTDPDCCSAFLEELSGLSQKWPSKLIAYVLMPDHFHLISNPRDGRIKEFVGALKSLSAKSIVRVCKQSRSSNERRCASSLARELQGHALVERLDDLAEDQLYSCQPSESGNREVRQRLSLVQLQVLLFARG